MTKAIEAWVKRNDLKFRTPAEREHLIDFLTKEYGQKKSINFSYDVCLKKSDEWVLKLNKKALLSKKQGSQKTVIDFKDGMRFVHLLDKEAVGWEGAQMGHCVASYDPKTIYSLRDENNFPHATVEIEGGEIKQIKGKGNKEVAARYVPYVVKFLEKKRLKVSNEWDMQKLGFIKVDSVDTRVIKATFENVKFFNGYVYKSYPKIKKGVNVLSYHMVERIETKWFQKDSTLYFNSINKLLGISNALSVYQEAAQSTRLEAPTLEDYKTLFLRDEQLAFSIINKFSIKHNWGELQPLLSFVDSPRSMPTISDELCFFLIEKGMRDSALKIFSRFLSYGLKGGCFKKVFSTDFLELKEKLLTSLIKECEGKDYFIFLLIVEINQKNLDLVLKHRPDLDLEQAATFKYVWENFESMSYIISLSKDKNKLKHVFLKKMQEHITHDTNVPIESLELLLSDIKLTEHQLNDLKQFAQKWRRQDFYEMIKKFPKENIAAPNHSVTVDFGGDEVHCLDLDQDPLAKAEFVRQIAARLGVLDIISDQDQHDIYSRM